MKKSLLSGLFWVLLANLAVKPFWLLGIEVGVQNAVGTEMYGFYFGVLNIAYIFNILLDFGLTNFNTRNIAQHPFLIKKHLSGILGVKVMLLALYLLVTFSVGLLTGYNTRQFCLLAILTFNQFLSSLILYLRSNFEGLLLFRWDSLLSVLDRVLMIAICGCMLWTPALKEVFSIFYFALAQTVAYLITAICAFVVIMRKTGFHGIHFSRPFTMAILKRSIPFALLVLLMASYNRIDPVLLQQLSPAGRGDFNAGIYAGAFRLLDALTMIVYLVSVPLLPIFSKIVGSPARGERKAESGKRRAESGELKAESGKRRAENGELKETVRIALSLVIVFSLTSALALSSESEELMALFYNDNINQYSEVFRILVFCIIPISLTYVFGTLLTAGGELRKLNIYASVALVLNVGVNCICIPLWGSVGSAWAGLTAQTFMAVAQVVTAIWLYDLFPSRSYMLKISIFALLVTGCTLVCNRMPWATSIAIVSAVSLATAFALKIINIKEIVESVSGERRTENGERKAES